MKYTEKFSNGYLTYEDKDIDAIAPNSFKEFFLRFLFKFACFGAIFGLLYLTTLL